MRRFRDTLPRMAHRLGEKDIRQLAELARLRLREEEVAAIQDQLSTILEHVARLDELDLDGVEPMAFAGAMTLTNRMEEDEVDETRLLSIEEIKQNAPAMEDHFIAVPKVLGEGAALER